MGYFKTAARGVTWVGGFRVITRVVSFARTIILARILMPSQFGVYAIATLVLAFLEVFTETGINIFLVQQKGKIDKYVDTAFVISIFRGFVVGALIYISSSSVANFFESPNALPLLRLISLVPIIRGFINPSIAKFQKDLHFGKDFLLRTSVFSIDSLVAILATIYLNSPIGIIIGLISGAIFEIVLSWAMAKPTPKFRIDLKKTKKIISHGKWVTLNGIFSYANLNIDDTFVGKMLNSSSLGIYQMSFKLSTLPVTEVTQVFNRVTLPVYVKISDDKLRLRKAFFKTLFTVSSITIPIGFALFLGADYLVPLLLGEQWSLAIPVLKVLSGFGVLRAIVGTFSAFYYSQKKQIYSAITQFAELVILIGLLMPFLKLFGLVGAGYATIIAILIPIPLHMFYLSMLLRKSAKRS